MATKLTTHVTIEGRPYELEDRPYTGAELRELAGLAAQDKLVLEETDGSETAIPPAKKVRLAPDANLYVAVRFRRG